MFALAATWGLRLASYLWVRNVGHGEDHRYQAMRRKHGERFGWISLRTVFGVQGAVMLVVAFPLVVAQSSAAPLGASDAIACVVWLCGLGFEAIGDLQLRRFKSDPANAGAVMDRGLWAWTRHPNYFGDFVVWWGHWGLAIAAGWPWFALAAIGPALMSFMLMRVSGVPMLEYSLRRNRPGYAEYAERTPAFFPRPPRAG